MTKTRLELAKEAHPELEEKQIIALNCPADLVEGCNVDILDTAEECAGIDCEGCWNKVDEIGVV